MYKRQQFTPHVDTGDYVIIVNADKIKVTGKKLEQKIYYNPVSYTHLDVYKRQLWKMKVSIR